MQLHIVFFHDSIYIIWNLISQPSGTLGSEIHASGVVKSRAVEEVPPVILEMHIRDGTSRELVEQAQIFLMKLKLKKDL